MITLLFHLTELLLPKDKKKGCTKTDAPFNLCRCFFFALTICRDAVFIQYTFDLAAQYLVSPAMCICSYPTMDLPHFIQMMNAITVDNTIKINVAITLATSMQNFFLKVITTSGLCCGCPCCIPVSVSMQRKPKPCLKSLFLHKLQL